MANNVSFEDYTIEVIGKLCDLIERDLLAEAGEIISQTQRNFDTAHRVDTGFTKGSFKYKVTGSAMAGEFTAHMGSDAENAIWEEFGTGEQSITGNGRKNWHGKSASRAFWKAYVARKNKVIARLQRTMKGSLRDE